MKYQNLTIVGTSHISPESLKDVENTILKEVPEIVALELDRKRFAALAGKAPSGRLRIKDIRRIGLKGFIFASVGAWIEQKLGAKTGVKPGSEMLLAFKKAQDVKARVALIDQDIEITLKRFSQELSWREKWHFVADLFWGIILRKPDLGFDLYKVPTQATIQQLVKKVRKRYPNIYKVLVTERNEFMALQLVALLRSFPDKKIVAVVGAGHENDIIKLVRAMVKE